MQHLIETQVQYGFLFLNKNKTSENLRKTPNQNQRTFKVRLEEYRLKLYERKYVIFFVHVLWASHNIDISAGS